ncbi:Arabinanase/levansucrase/invertase [Dendrothele bispora CBS 962.96]|uniref:Arabinanase/levansucrase/invertase n=1 Tax=Dendrothele bispora (strain CBS 962.96) TaxID=1314807 RepID=A0A4S8KX90_DENBC|nr:Arabinanase/levansucrase/invertase [Dendrothele bispora CBS 962.96]
MRFIDGRYFLTSTQGGNIQMRSATTVEGLKTAQAKVLFDDTTAGRNVDFWAPEFWFLDGTWYIYYAVAGNQDGDTHHLHVLRGGTDPNDPSAGPYTYVNSLIPSNFDQWAVDGSVLQIDNQRYLIFSGLESSSPWTQCTYIVRMTSQTSITGDAVQISCPNLSWEIIGTPVQEGPEAITINGVTHIVYSASHCSTDDYALGMLTLTNDADPMVAASWTKSPNPLFTRNDAAGVYGPGHHFMFQKGDNFYFAYHGKAAPGLGCGNSRTTRVQPFSISGSNPVFPAAVATGVPVAEPVA